MIKTLRHYGFGENFINWIKIIYKDCSSRVKVNGFTTPPFSIDRGVRQGCPLSCLLYVLCLESLCLEIKNNNKIIGIKFEGHEHKDIEYVDDMSLAITDLESIDEIFGTLGKFEKATNSKINVDKTEGLWAGTWINNVEKPKNLKWTNTEVKSLGVYVGNNRKDVEKIGFEARKEKIKDKLKFWGGKGLSLKGRIRVVNSRALSQLWNTASVQDMPLNIKAEVNTMVKNFIWEGKYSQRSVEGLEEEYSNGGLRLENIDKKN